MAMKQRERTPRRAGEEAGTPADESALRHGGVRKCDTFRRCRVAEKLTMAEEFVQCRAARLSMSYARGTRWLWIVSLDHGGANRFKVAAALMEEN
jgi:hypothetical protein